MKAAGSWYPVALARDVEPGQAAGTRLFDQELCLWRDSARLAHVWEDRCPHRGMRLSFGFVRGDRIGCLYHGWQYDRDGQCRLIPAHPDLEIPSTICVTTYACTETLGMVWAYSEPTSLPAPLSIASCETTPVRSLYVDCAPPSVIDHLLAAKNAATPADNLMSFEIGEQKLLAGVQPFGGNSTALHIFITGAPNLASVAARRRIAIWAEELRRKLERKACSPAAMVPEFSV